MPYSDEYAVFEIDSRGDSSEYGILAIEFFSIFYPFSRSSQYPDRLEEKGLSEAMRRFRFNYISKLVSEFDLPIRRLSFGFSQDFISREAASSISPLVDKSKDGDLYYGVTRYCYIGMKSHLLYFIDYSASLEDSPEMFPKSSKKIIQPLLSSVIMLNGLDDSEADRLIRPFFSIISLEQSIIRNELSKKIYSFSDREFMKTRMLRNRIG